MYLAVFIEQSAQGVIDAVLAENRGLARAMVDAQPELLDDVLEWLGKNRVIPAPPTDDFVWLTMDDVFDQIQPRRLHAVS